MPVRDGLTSHKKVTCIWMETDTCTHTLATQQQISRTQNYDKSENEILFSLKWRQNIAFRRFESYFEKWFQMEEVKCTEIKSQWHWSRCQSTKVMEQMESVTLKPAYTRLSYSFPIESFSIDLVMDKIGMPNSITQKKCSSLPISINCLNVIIIWIYPDCVRMNQSRTCGLSQY